MGKNNINTEVKGQEKLGLYSMITIGVAYAITINNFTVGSKVGLGMTFVEGLIAIFIAWICLALIWTLAGLMGQITGENAAVIFKYIFGTRGGKIPSFCIVVCNWVWAAFDYWYVGSVMRNMMPDHPYAGFVVGMIIIVAAVIFGIIKDISSLKWLTGITVPISIILFIAIWIVVVQRSEGMEYFMSYQPTEHISLVFAINLMIGSFTAVSIGFPDITRSAKSKKVIIIAMPIAMLTVCFQFIVAQFGAIGMQCVDITSLALSLGGAIFYIINFFVLVGQSNTSPSSSLIIVTQVTELFNNKVPRIVFVFLQPITAGIISIIIEFGADITFLNTWVGFAATIFSSLIGTIFSEFYLVRRRKIDKTEQLPSWFAPSLISLSVGFALAVYLTYLCPIPTPVFIVSFAVSFILQFILRKVMATK